MKRVRKLKPSVLALLLLFAFAAEAFMGNYSYLINNSGNGEVRDYRCDSLQPLIEINSEKDYFIVDDVAFEAANVSFNVRADGATDAKAVVYARLLPEDEVYSYVAETKFNASTIADEVTVFLGQAKEYDSLYIAFSDYGENLEVSDVIVNKSAGFGFNILRFAVIVFVLTAVYCLSRFEIGEITSGANYSDASFYAVVLTLICSLSVTALCLSGDGGVLVAYPFKGDLAAVNPYYQQFDAFIKGQMHLDIEPSAQLLALENPYDPVQRDGIFYLWDRAFFDGKYFSYFGTAPIILIFFPFYLITGMLPSISLTMGVFSAVAAVFFALAVVEYSKIRKAKVSPIFAAFVAVGAFLASTILFVQRGNAQFYYLASVAAAAFTSLFIFFMLKAYASGRKKSCIYYVLAGTAFGAGMHSRVNAMLPLAVVAVTYVVMLLVSRVKEKNIKRFVCEAASLGLPVAAAGSVLFWYNYSRFGNVFDFGTAYQLTVADTSLYELNAGGILPGIYHYFIQPFRFTAKYPFVELQNINLGNYGRYVYVDSGLGVFAFPFNILLLLCPVLFKSKGVSGKGKAVFAAAIASLFVTAYVDFCLGGVIFRYTADIAPVSAFLAAVIAIEVSDFAWVKLGRGGAKMFKYAVAVLFAATVLVFAGSSLMTNGNIKDYSPQIHRILEDLFVFWI